MTPQYSNKVTMIILEAIRGVLRALARDGRLQRVRAVYLLTYFANPSALSRSEADKNALAALLAEHEVHVPVIEDNRLVGIVTETDFLNVAASLMESELRRG